MCLAASVAAKRRRTSSAVTARSVLGGVFLARPTRVSPPCLALPRRRQVAWSFAAGDGACCGALARWPGEVLAAVQGELQRQEGVGGFGDVVGVAGQVGRPLGTDHPEPGCT